VKPMRSDVMKTGVEKGPRATSAGRLGPIGSITF
jgi:hypothetical protein